MDDIVLPPVIGPTISHVLCNVAIASFNIALAASTIAILIGAFFYLTSGGNPERMNRGKKSLMYAIYGIAVLMLSWGAAFIIADFLGGADVSFTGCELPPTP